MLLKKQKETVEDDIVDSEAKSEYSAGEITVSQLDFCRGKDNMSHFATNCYENIKFYA